MSTYKILNNSFVNYERKTKSKKHTKKCNYNRSLFTLANGLFVNCSARS